jgi:hypothetical protein
MAREVDDRRPRSSAQVMKSSIDDMRASRRRRSWLRRLFTLALLGFLVWGANVSLVGNPVKASLAADPRTAGIGLVGHLNYYVDPTTIVLDLARPAGVDTANLFRAALMTGRRLLAPGLVNHVVLARLGQPVYELSGADYRRLGLQLAEGRNPVLVMRDLPAALRLPDGTTAPAADASEAARLWAGGAP